MRYRTILIRVQDLENSRRYVIVNDAILSDFQKKAVREIGLRSFFKSSTFFFLGSGDTSAYFQIVGRRCSCRDALIILHTG